MQAASCRRKAARQEQPGPRLSILPEPSGSHGLQPASERHRVSKSRRKLHTPPQIQVPPRYLRRGKTRRYTRATSARLSPSGTKHQPLAHSSGNMLQKSAGYAIAAFLSLPLRAAAAKAYSQSPDSREEASFLALAPAGAYRLFPPTTSITFVYLRKTSYSCYGA